MKKGWIAKKYYLCKKTNQKIFSSYYLQYYDHTGKVVSKSLKTKLKTEANLKLAEFRLGKNEHKAEHNFLYLKEEALKYAAGQKFTYSTIYHYKLTFNLLEKYLLENDNKCLFNLNNLNPKIMQKFINEISLKYSSGTVNIIIRNLKNIFRLAVNWNVTANNPAFYLSELIQKKNIVYEFNEYELNEILDEALSVQICRIGYEKILRNENFRDMIIMLYDTGMRLNELCNLQISDIKYINGVKVIHISNKDNFNPKRKKERFIPMTKRVEEIINSSIPSIDGYIFGRKYDKRYISKLFRKILDKLGYEKRKYCIHSLRHSFIKRLVKNGVDIKTGSVLMGHSRISTTEGYINSNVNDCYEAIMKLN